MSQGFETISRSLGRRSFMKAALAGVAIVLVKPFRARAATSCPAGFTPCGTRCCNKGVACIDGGTSRCGCQPGFSKCGDACCPAGHACYSPSNSCCCAAGTTPCGPTCCKAGIACVDSVNGVCGCPAGTVPGRESSGTVTCCPRGQQWHTGCPPATGTTAGCACRRYADPCTTDDQCCSRRCNDFKSDACGCQSDGDCPSTTPYCIGSIGICDSSPAAP